MNNSRKVLMFDLLVGLGIIIMLPFMFELIAPILNFQFDFWWRIYELWVWYCGIIMTAIILKDLDNQK